MVGLDPSSRKYICPRCGKKTFVVYLDNNRQIIDPSCGRCDRQDKCAHHLTPREFFAQRRTLTPYMSSGKQFTSKFYTPPRPLPILEKDPLQSPSYLACDFYSPLLATDPRPTPLFRAIMKSFNGVISVKELLATYRDYLVGTTKKRETVFLQVDSNNRVRTGKVMSYDATGHRTGRQRWLHTSAPQPYRLCQVLFGAHLLSKPDAIPMLFESEKTALIVATLLRHWGVKRFVPVATGGCGGFNPNVERMQNPWHALHSLKGRQVVLFPDNGKYAEWEERSKRIEGIAKRVLLSNLIEPSLYPPGELIYSGNPMIEALFRSDITIELGNDLADILFRALSHRHIAPHLRPLLLDSQTLNPPSPA